MILTELYESSHSCPECGGPAFSDLILAEKQDACYHKVRSRYKVWPSAYASGALVQCRKKGAANWGNKSESMEDPVGEYGQGVSEARRNRTDWEMDAELWFKEIDGKMWQTSIFPNQRAQARAEGWAPSKQEARDMAYIRGLAPKDKPSVSEGSSTLWEVSYDYGPHMTKTVTVNAGSKEEAAAKVEKDAERRGLSIMINSVTPAEQGVSEGTGPQVGDAVYYGTRLVGWFKGYSEHGKIITEPNEEEMGDEYSNRDVYWDPQDKITIKPDAGVMEGSLMEDPVTAFASKAHDEWRQGWIKQNSGKSVPRIKKNSDGSEGDINVPFGKLHPDWQRENLAAGRAAMQAVKQFPNDIEKASEFIHNEWMKRNPKADYNAAQHVPYDQLPEPEKEKDRVHARTMMQLMGKSGVTEGAHWSDEWEPLQDIKTKTGQVVGMVMRHSSGTYAYYDNRKHNIESGFSSADQARQAFVELHNARVRSNNPGVAEGLDAEEYKEKLLATLPQMMRFYEKNVQGWKPSKEQMLAAVETGYTVMKHTGDVKQAGRAVMDELNTLHRMSQGQQGVTEGSLEEISQDTARSYAQKARASQKDLINQTYRKGADTDKLNKKIQTRQQGLNRAHTDKRYYKDEHGVAEGLANANETLRSQIIRLYKKGLEDYDIAYDLDIDEKTVADIIDDYDKKQQQRQSKVAEGYKFKGGFPFDVDHMPGAVHRNADMITDNVKTNDKTHWARAVDSINARVFDDMSEFSTDSHGETVTGNGAVWAKWDNATQTGWFNAEGRPLRTWAVKEQGVEEGFGDIFKKRKNPADGIRVSNGIAYTGDKVNVEGYPKIEGVVSFTHHHNGKIAVMLYPKGHRPMALAVEPSRVSIKQGVAEAWLPTYNRKTRRRGGERLTPMSQEEQDLDRAVRDAMAAKDLTKARQLAYSAKRPVVQQHLHDLIFHLQMPPDFYSPTPRPPSGVAEGSKREMPYTIKEINGRVEHYATISDAKKNAGSGSRLYKNGKEIARHLGKDVGWMPTKQGVAEGWKEKVAGATIGAAALGGIGAGIANSPMAYVNGQQIHMAMPGKIPDHAKLVTDDDGKKIYVWKPVSARQGTLHQSPLVYRPAEPVNEQGVTEGPVLDKIKNTAKKAAVAFATSRANPIAYAMRKGAGQSHDEFKTNVKKGAGLAADPGKYPQRDNVDQWMIDTVEYYKATSPNSVWKLFCPSWADYLPTRVRVGTSSEVMRKHMNTYLKLRAANPEAAQVARQNFDPDHVYPSGPADDYRVNEQSAEPIKNQMPVEAWGYRYDRRDQRVAWRKQFSELSAAEKWAALNNATMLGYKAISDMSEGWKGEFAGGTAGSLAGGIAGSSAGASVGPTVGGTIGGLAGGLPGAIAGMAAGAAAGPVVGAAMGGTAGGMVGGRIGDRLGGEPAKEDATTVKEIAPVVVAAGRMAAPWVAKKIADRVRAARATPSTPATDPGVDEPDERMQEAGSKKSKELVGDRYEPSDFDAMLARVRQLAGAGELKTVWDPTRRTYRNMPTAQQPKDKK